MQYPEEKIEDAIYYILSLNPDVFFTVDELYDIIKKDKICNVNSKSALKTRFSSMELNFTNLCICEDKIKFIKNNDNNDNNLINVSNLSYDMVSVVNNPERYPNVKFNIIYENGQTIQHLLCISGNINLLKKIHENFGLDFNVKNSQGETIMDVSSDPFVLKTLSDFKTAQLEEKYISINYELKSQNNSLQDTNYKLNLELEKSKKKGYQALVISILSAIFLAIMWSKLLIKN
mgnify:CR=1 FL=1|jgi:hypothetical protein